MALEAQEIKNFLANKIKKSIIKLWDGQDYQFAMLIK